MSPEPLLSDDPTWYKDAVIYQLHVKAFADSNGDGIGDFGGLTSRLDYLQDLGVTAVWLLPFYPSPLRDDGYDIADYEGVHESYGDMRAFRRFLDQAHARGLRVITELVINHTSDEHAWFQRARNAPRGSAHRDFYVWSDTPEKYADARIIFKDFETSNWTWDPVAGQYYWHRFYSHQPDLNFESPAVRRAVIRLLDKWFAMGVDGVRLDAIPYLYEEDGTNCENLPKTHEFLRMLRAHVDAHHPNRMLLAEANQWPEDAVAYFGDGDECHMAFHFPLMPRLYMALRREDRHPIVDILEQTPEIPGTAQWATFLRNHDELTLEMVTDEERDYMYRTYAHDPRMRINLGIRRRLAPLLQGDRRKIELLNAVLFSLPGTPVMYYGDEIGMGDNVYLGDRDGVRTPMQWSSDRNAGFSQANPQRLYLPVIIDPDYHYETVNVEALRGNANSLWWWMHRLISLRTSHRAFGHGGLRFLTPDNPKVLAFLRTPSEPGDGDTLLVVANLSRYAQAAELDLGDLAGATPVELFGHTPFAPVTERPYAVTLAPYGFYWFRLVPQPTSEGAASPSEAPLVTMDDDPLARRAASGIGRALAAWLPQRRWFHGKARVVRSVSVLDAVPLDGRRPLSGTLLVVEVDFSEGDPETYCVPVAVLPADGGHEVAEGNLIARVRRSDGREGLLVDALGETETPSSLVRLVVRQSERKGRAGRVRGWSVPDVRDWPAEEEPDTKVLRGEQSNTSIRVGDRAILKLYRRLDDGTSPELEVGRHLQRVGYAGGAGLLGSVEYVRPRGEPVTLAAMHEFVANDGDAWQWVLERLNLYAEQVLALPDTPPRVPADPLSSTPAPLPEEMVDLLAPWAASADQIGRRTAEMHEALARGDDPAFRPEPFTTLYQRSLYQSILGETRATLRMLRSPRARLDEEQAQLVAALPEDRLLDRLDQLRARRLHVSRVRHHGDFHLGQMLWTGRDFVIIDFEGEPSRSVGERRIKRSPLRDVAGMLRSFDYAANVGMRDQVERLGFASPAAAEARLGPWARAWSAWMSASFLSSYLDAVAGQPFVPEDTAELRLLLDAFMLEKTCYEVRYELGNRPDWVGIPLRALHELVEAFPATASEG
ncbi:MAG: maltose alpha-D-glucosyltransferase [Frankiales bacterium]|nr:maltose alpha-D-glucosyltransferase [Frankiales bacterium]